MYAKVVTGSLCGMEAETVIVETDLSAGLPNITIVGLPDASVREAKERIRTAVINGGFSFPMKRITVNLSPADTKKEGSHFDLPIAICVMAAAAQVPMTALEGMGFLGELSLDGSLIGIRGALPLAIGLRKQGIRELMLPLSNAEEVAVLLDMTIYGAAHLSEIAGHLEGKQRLQPYQKKERSISSTKKSEAPDFCDVAGQEEVKRALQIAAAAAHNLLMVGPPGAGKTMMARRLPGILPSMTYEEQLEVTKIYSVVGEVSEGQALIEERPFRAPHHTITPIALIGGGVRPKPGEVSLAHYGVLFLDELPEFRRSVLEVLRQPLEDKQVLISRATTAVSFPSKFMLLAAMNPCPCGFLGDSIHQCTCTDYQIQRYLSKISGPLVDRIDMRVEILPVGFSELCGEGVYQKKGRTSKELRFEVEAARALQIERYKKEVISYNSELSPSLIKKYCVIDKESNEILRLAFQKYGLSARAHQKVLKISRTIADIEGSEIITLSHVAEALRYRINSQKVQS
ncbi:MAG: YifB family Mg chelatase-like AAA ATPase [Eubacteriales bacterium]|nr:YifB family Mg chelatase-like AAA ATPase [Eubacteriales bacterium]